MGKFNDSESWRHYISLLQENITRMSANCTSCKNWLITIVSALFALQLANASLKPYLWISLVPTVLFLVLDAYYLGQEKRFRDLENRFVRSIKSDEDVTDLIYSFSDEPKEKWRYFLAGLKSPSTWLLYLVMVLAIIVISILIG